MAKSGPEIQDALRRLVAKWQPYAGSEKAEAQTFLNELFAAYGTDRFEVGAKFEDFRASAGFMDLHWPGICIIEMKAPGRDVAVGRAQVKRYWEESADETADIPAARWVLICSFQKLEIWEPGRFPANPRMTLDLADLPDRYDSLNFLAGPNVEPVFVEHYRELTKQAAERIATMYQSLVDRSAAPPDEIQRFVMQAVWCLFAEDLGMLSGYPLQSTVSELIQRGGSSAERIGFLFRVLNQKGSHNRKGVLEGTTYVNGELFAEPAEVDLDVDELRLLLEASQFDWRKVDPTIFGSLMEGVLGHDRRWELGAHYTHEVDIMKIVTPTIVRPWQQRIDAASTPAEARALLDDLCAFKVLDPACGCGNFLYVAYRELRALEHLLKQRIIDLARSTGRPEPEGPLPYVALTNMQGIDIERAAVMIARVTLWMGHRQMIERYGAAEDPLPLVTLSSIKRDDALFSTWPETDCIIGNPPFLGSQLIRRAFGDAYVDQLKQRFGVGVKDFCVYWFRLAADHLAPGQRAGLVGTNSVSQNKARSASLDYVVSQGGVITDAVSSQKWPGEAKVHVSLVNWVEGAAMPQPTFTLDGLDVVGISSSLTAATANAWTARVLTANAGRCFQGPIPVGAGFILAPDEASGLFGSAGPDYRSVVRPFLTTENLSASPTQAPGRWVIDFAQLPLEAAGRFPLALAIVRERVKPERDLNRDAGFRTNWWQFGRPRVELRRAIGPFERHAVSTRHGKFFLAVWASSWTMASDATNVFAFEDDFSMGVLQSRAHVAWAWARSSTLETRLRYTPTSVFETFAWPDRASGVQREAVAEACRRLLARRSVLCLEHNVGLTKLYNAMDEGAYADLLALHRELDEAVADCYGWPKSVAQSDKELVARLTDLNRQIVEGERDYAPFAYLDNHSGSDGPSGEAETRDRHGAGDDRA